MNESKKVGLSFGITSGVITTLGLFIGLALGTGDRIAVLSGVLTIAVADALSDAFGIHITEEAKEDSTPQSVWAATLATFAVKFLVALTFLVPILLLSIPMAIIAGISWGMFLLISFSIYIARTHHESVWGVVTEHVSIATLVLFASYLVGNLIAWVFR